MSDPTRQQAAAYRAAAPESLSGLHAGVTVRMAAIAAAFWTLETKAGAERAPRVFDSQLPPLAASDAKSDDPRFPYIIVRTRSGSDSPQEGHQVAAAMVELELGITSDTDAGNEDLRQLIDAIRFSIAGEPVLEGTAYEHTGPLTWDFPETQPRPLWLALVTTNWTLPRPRRNEALNPTED